MTLFWLIYDKTDWEATNDNANPYVMNWDYYNQVYSSPEFQKMWDMAAYFNQKGISNGLMFDFQGNGPAWLGSPALKTGMEAEWAEMVASLLIYARQTNHLQFGLVGPDNEMNQTPQGVNMTAAQYATALHDLSQLPGYQRHERPAIRGAGYGWWRDDVYAGDVGRSGGDVEGGALWYARLQRWR